MLKVFYSENIDALKQKGLHWADSFSTACFFDSNQYADPYSAFDLFIAAGIKKELIHSVNDSI